MKKRIPCIVLALVLMIAMSACSAEAAKREESNPQKLNVNDLIRENGSFGWSDIEWGCGIDDAEKQGEITFPEIPYRCAEKYLVPPGETPTEIFDYRNNNNYESVEYLAYIADSPLVLEYGDYIGYIDFEFHQGALVSEAIYFGTGVSGYDSNMTFEGSKNDPAAIYESLYADISSALGEPADENETETNGISNQSTTWDSEKTADGAYRTRISLHRQFNENDDMAYLLLTYFE